MKKVGMPAQSAREVAHLTCPPEYSAAQVRVRSLDANLGGETLGLVCRRFLLLDLLLSTPIRSPRFRFLLRNSGESSLLPVLQTFAYPQISTLNFAKNAEF
jgi:hypothetical protein